MVTIRQLITYVKYYSSPQSTQPAPRTLPTVSQASVTVISETNKRAGKPRLEVYRETVITMIINVGLIVMNSEYQHNNAHK